MTAKLDTDELLHRAWVRRRAEALRTIAIRAAEEYRILIKRHGLEEEIADRDARAVRLAWRQRFFGTRKPRKPTKGEANENDSEPRKGGSPHQGDNQCLF